MSLSSPSAQPIQQPHDTAFFCTPCPQQLCLSRWFFVNARSLDDSEVTLCLTLKAQLDESFFCWISWRPHFFVWQQLEPFVMLASFVVGCCPDLSAMWHAQLFISFKAAAKPIHVSFSFPLGQKINLLLMFLTSVHINWRNFTKKKTINAINMSCSLSKMGWISVLQHVAHEPWQTCNGDF